MRAFAAILACLVFQLAQLAPVFAGSVDCTIAPSMDAGCSCCDGLDGCPCASQSDPGPSQQRLPLHAGESVKLPLPVITDARVAMNATDANVTDSRGNRAEVTAWSGFYCGVPLRTAFCSFVI